MIKIYNLFIRIFSIFPKLFLIVIISKKWSLNEIGSFNLFSTSIILLTFILGLDYYNYSNRKLIECPKTERINIIFKQFFFYLLTYCIVLPLSYFLFYKSSFPQEWTEYFYLILITEHLSQEIYRILNILEKQLVASVLLTIRTGLWIFILVLFTYNWSLNVINISMSTVLSYWTIGCVISFLCSMFILYKEISFLHSSDFSFSFLELFNWYKDSFKITALYLMMTISYKSLEYGGRYFVTYFHGLETLGIYSIFYQISNLINIFVEASIITFLYPKLVKFYTENNKLRFKEEVDKSIKRILGICFFFGIILILGEQIIFSFLSKKYLSNYLNLYIIILAGNTLFMTANLYHYGLYGMQKDNAIFKSTIYGFLINIISTLILLPILGIYSVAVGSFIAYLVLFLLKYFYFKQFFEKWIVN